MNILMVAEGSGQVLAHPSYFIPGALGGLVLELLQLQTYRQQSVTRAKAKKVVEFLQSPLYWACSLGMIALAGLVAWLMNADGDHFPGTTHLFMTGLAARTIVREVTKAVQPAVPEKKELVLGSGVTFRDIFS